MIEDILFEKLEFPATSNFNMQLIPPSSSYLRASSGRGALSVGGLLPRHSFSSSDQPLTGTQVRAISELQNRSRGRCVLFQNPFAYTVSDFRPQLNKYGSFNGGCFIRPSGGVRWQPALYYGTSSLDKIALRPVVWAENIITEDDGPITYDFVTKQGTSLPEEDRTVGTSQIKFATFDYWIAVRIVQFEKTPIRERTLNTTCGSEAPEYKVSINLEEDPTVSLPVFFSWPTSELFTDIAGVS